MEHELIDIKLIKQKIQHYCALQERCQLQVIKKLITYGVHSELINKLIIDLKALDYLNEERFSRSYCSGKFKMNKWGKQKIAFELSKLQVPKQIINLGMLEINHSEYLQKLTELCSKKYNHLKDTNLFIRKKKVVNYLIGKGYESDLVWTCVNQL